MNGTQINDGQIYYEKRKANENIAKVYTRKGFRGKERLLVDPQMYDKDGEHAAVDLYAPFFG